LPSHDINRRKAKVGVGLQLGVSPNPSPQSIVIKRVTPNGEVFLFVATPL